MSCSPFCYIQIPRTGTNTMVDVLKRSGVETFHSHLPASAHLSCYNNMYALIRNPLDRILSGFTWIDAAAGPNGRQERFERWMSQGKFTGMAVRPQVKFLHPDVEVWPFEKMHALYHHLCDKYNLERAEIAHLHSSNHLPKHTCETIRITMQAFKEDTERYNRAVEEHCG